MNQPHNPGREGIHAFRDSDQREPLRNDVSPFTVGLNMRIVSIDARAGRLRATFDPGEHYIGGARPTVHGGAMATMLDISMATLVVAMTGADQRTATANLNVSFLRPLPPGPCTCEVEAERVGRTVAFMRAVLLDAAGGRAATGSATFPLFTAS
jgi:uncharacterized protein (TIGR00369 family)